MDPGLGDMGGGATGPAALAGQAVNLARNREETSLSPIRKEVKKTCKTDCIDHLETSIGGDLIWKNILS